MEILKAVSLELLAFCLVNWLIEAKQFDSRHDAKYPS
jgi:hypothetical protein